MNDKRKTVKDDKRPGRLVCVCSAKGKILYNAYEKLNRQKDKNRSENNATYGLFNNKGKNQT